MLSSLSYSDSCDSNERGIEVFYPFCRADIESVTINWSTLQVSAIEFKIGKEPVKLEFDTDTAYFNQEMQEGTTLKFNQSFYYERDGLDNASGLIIAGYDREKCLSGVCVDANGKGHLVGLSLNVNTETWKFKDKANGAGTSNTGTGEGEDDPKRTRTYNWNNIKNEAVSLVPSSGSVVAYMDSLIS